MHFLCHPNMQGAMIRDPRIEFNPVRMDMAKRVFGVQSVRPEAVHNMNATLTRHLKLDALDSLR